MFAAPFSQTPPQSRAMMFSDSRDQSVSYAPAARVLIADDQADVLEALRILLKSAGYEIEMAATPRMAIERLQSAAFDAIIMDLNYTLDTTSGREGMDLLSAVKAADAGIPVIVMTAWATVDLAIEALRRGASDFIQKPWDNAQVLDTVATQVARRRRRVRDLSSQRGELEDAHSVQRALLPHELPSVPGFELAAWTQAARAVGGDYYDVVPLAGDRVAFIIADVCGKGIPAALTMSNLQGALKTLIKEDSRPASLCRKLNQFLAAHMIEGRFVSLFCAVLESASGSVQFCNAGHQPPLVMRKLGSVVRLETGGAVLGHFGDWSYEQGEIVLEPGDSLVLFTDGISEARDGAETEFGEGGIASSMPADPANAEAISDAISSAVRRHCQDRFEDDATLLVVRRNG